MSSIVIRFRLRRPVSYRLTSRLMILVSLIAFAVSLVLSFGGPPSLTFAMAPLGSRHSHSPRAEGTARMQFPSALPANGKIAFSSGRDTGGNRSQIYLMNAGGSNVVRLTNNSGDETQPRWSPDGSRIAFTTDRDKVCDFFNCYSEIYSMNADGSSPARLTNNMAVDTSPVWSPAGSKIAFQTNRDGNYEIYVMNADGSSPVRLTNNPDFDVLPSWSPDGNKIAFQRGINEAADIYIMNADGSNPVRITNNGNPSTDLKDGFSGEVIDPGGVEDTEPAWSPDGTRIAFSSNRDGHYEIYLMNPDGTSQTRLTNDASVQSGIPAWSPDATRIVFTSANITDQNGTSFEISVMNADGSNRIKLTNNSAFDWEPAWQPVIAAPPSTNPIDGAQNFVRQHYLDFLNREPDQGGWDYWTSGMTECGNDAVCIHSRRIGVSAAFFIELEFQETGYVVYRIHRAAFGALPTAPSRANLVFARFMSDRAQLVAGPGLSQSTINFANNFVQRPEFLQGYPTDLSRAKFVNQLFDTANLTPFDLEREEQIRAMNNGKTRAQVLLDVIEIATFKTREYNGAFVLMQYFGYLRRDPEQGGYDYWLDVLNNQVPDNFRAMVCAFLTSREYQLRFGTIVTRTDHDCAQL